LRKKLFEGFIVRCFCIPAKNGFFHFPKIKIIIEVLTSARVSIDQDTYCTLKHVQMF